MTRLSESDQVVSRYFFSRTAQCLSTDHRTEEIQSWVHRGKQILACPSSHHG